jgi:hypothetical protein
MKKIILAFLLFIAPVSAEQCYITNPSVPVTLTGCTYSGSLPPDSTNYIRNTQTLQSGATFYVSSGSVAGQFSPTSIKWPDGTVQVSSPSATSGVGGGTWGTITGDMTTQSDLNAWQNAATSSTNTAKTRLDNLDSSTATTKTRLDNLDTSTGTTNTRLNNLDSSTTTTNTRLNNLDSSTNTLQSNINGKMAFFSWPTCGGTDKLTSAGTTPTCAVDQTAGGATWGSITGTLSAQTDLQAVFTSIGISSAAIAVDTGSINIDLQGWKTITRSSFTTVATDTGAINTDLQGWKTITRSSFTTVATDTTSLRTSLNTVATDTTTLKTQLNTVATDTTTIASNLTTEISNRVLTGAATGLINTDLQGWKTITRSSFTTVATDTTTLKTQLNTVATDTTTLKTQLNTVATDTTTLKTRMNLVESSTYTLSLATTSIATSTGAINVDLQGWKAITRSSFTTVATDTTTLQTNINGKMGNTSAAVIAAFSGCSAIQYLGADGACHTDQTADPGAGDNLGSGVGSYGVATTTGGFTGAVSIGTDLSVTKGIVAATGTFTSGVTAASATVTGAGGLRVAYGVTAVTGTFTTSLTLPQGSNPTVDTIGEIAWDTTDGQLLVDDGVSDKVVGFSTHCFSVNVSSGQTFVGLNEPIWTAPPETAITITQIKATSLPTGTTVLFQLDEAASAFDSAGTDVFSVKYSSAIYPTATTTSFANAGIAAGATLVLNCPAAVATGGTPRSLFLQICYQRNRE